MRKQKPWKVFIAIILGIVIGSLTPKGTLLFGADLYSLYALLGKIFINALMMIVVPLVAASIISGISKIASQGHFKRTGGTTFIFYLGTSLIAILIGLLFVNLLNPGSAISPDQLLNQASVAELQQQFVQKDTTRLHDFFLEIIPSNIFDALAKGKMLSLIFFSLLFGYCISKTKEGSSLHNLFESLFKVMIELTHILMKFLPIGVFFLVAKVFSETGVSSFLSLGLFSSAVLLGLVTFMFIAMPIVLKLIGRVNPFWHFKAMGPALVTAFSTSSSSATLPITIDCVEKKAGVSNQICSLVIPLGTSVNMSGSALYECVAAMFVAQAYGIDLSFANQFLIVLLSLITSIGVAGIPSASLVAIIAILKVMGLPIEGIGLFIAVDRLLDMCRTTVNVFSDSCCAVLVAKMEGETNVLSVDPSNIKTL